jgi:ribonuclease HII
MPAKTQEKKSARQSRVNPRSAQVDDLACLKDLLAFDRGHIFSGKSRKPSCIILGVDEVGRGCLAGPVVAGAVLLPPIDPVSELGRRLKDLNDSKKLSAPQRERLSVTIKEVAKWTVGQASVEEIDEINILNASFLAMKRAIDQLNEMVPNDYPIVVLVDGNKRIKNLAGIQTPVVDGDAKSASIAAASIIAKVHRDALMQELHHDHPHYCWQQNKGYGSRAHREAIDVYGLTTWHRQSFCQKLLQSDEMELLESSR